MSEGVHSRSLLPCPRRPPRGDFLGRGAAVKYNKVARIHELEKMGNSIWAEGDTQERRGRTLEDETRLHEEASGVLCTEGQPTGQPASSGRLQARREAWTATHSPRRKPPAPGDSQLCPRRRRCVVFSDGTPRKLIPELFPREDRARSQLGTQGSVQERITSSTPRDTSKASSVLIDRFSVEDMFALY